MADDRIRAEYNIDGMLKRIPADRAEFFTGFVPAAEDVQGWRRSVHEREPGTKGRTQTRTVWDDPKDRAARILIDVIACDSTADAADMLATVIENNQSGRLLAGPDGLGLASFMHPENAPPAVFFVYANLTILVTSFGEKPAEVLPTARHLSAKLEQRPDVSQPTLSLNMLAAADNVTAGQEIGLDYKARFSGGEDAYWKFVIDNGTMVRRDGRLNLRPFAAGRLRVESYLIEAGHPPQFGMLELSIRG